MKEAYTAQTLSFCSFFRTRCWNKIMSCVLRRTPSPLPLRFGGTPGAQIFCWFLLQSRRWLRRHVGRWSRSSSMHAYSSVSLVSSNVPRMRLCSSLFVAQNSTCNAGVNAECATNEVVQFFVCCATVVLSVGLLFFNVESAFLRPCLFQRLVRNFSFKLCHFKG